MAARSKMVKSTIRIKILTKSRKTSSNLGWEQKQGLQRAISSTLASHFPKPHLPEAPPGPWTRSFSGPHPGHPPPAPLCAPPPSHWRPKTCALLRYPPKAGNVAPPSTTLGRDGTLTPQLLILPPPREPRPWKLSHQHQPACDKKSSPDGV